MADFGSPIVDPNAPPAGQRYAQFLNSILESKQKQQALQIGQQTLATGTAEAQQAQQKNMELQALASLQKNAATDPKYHKEDGTFDTEKFTNDASALGPYALSYVGQAANNANAMVENRKALLGLSNDQRQTIGQYFGAVAANPNATRDDFLDAAEQARGVSEDRNYQRMVDRMLMGAPNVRNMPTDQASQAIRGWSRMLAMGSGAPDTAQSGPQIGQVTTPGGDVGFTQTNPQSPLGMGRIGPAVGQGVAPTLVSPPGGIPTPYKGSGPVPNPAAPGGGPQPTTQDIENFGAYNSNLNNRAAVASRALPQLQAAEQAIDAMKGGAGAETRTKIAQKLQAVGAPQSLVDSVANGNLAASQEAQKYLFINTMSQLQTSMSGHPFAGQAEAASELLPNIGTDPRASKEVLRFMSDQNKRDLAEQQALTTARKSGQFNPATWQGEYQKQLAAGKVPGTPESQVPKGEQKGGKVATQKDLEAYASKHGLSTEAAKQWAIKNGFKIQ